MMKKITVGATFFLSGLMTIIGALICGAINATTLNGWSGNKLIYSTFNTNQLNLGILVTFAALLSTFGLIFILIELFDRKTG